MNGYLRKIGAYCSVKCSIVHILFFRWIGVYIKQIAFIFAKFQNAREGFESTITLEICSPLKKRVPQFKKKWRLMSKTINHYCFKSVFVKGYYSEHVEKKLI